MGRLEIGNKNDIKKVIQYELNLGFNRITNKQETLKEYEIDFCATFSDTITVEAYNEDSACDIAFQEFKNDCDYDIDDFDPTRIKVYENGEEVSRW